MDTKKLSKGSILSETSYFTVQGIEGQYANVVNDNGETLKIGLTYIEKACQSADLFDSIEEKTMTELAELFINSSRVAMTVAYYKKDQVKAKKVYEAEKAAKIEEIQNARVADVPALLNDLIENPISKVTPGELRVMKGRHYGHTEESIKLGRVNFIDMEEDKGTNPEHDGRLRQVDTRTIQYLIVAGVKYILKK